MKSLPWIRVSFFAIFGLAVLLLAFFAVASSGERVAAATKCDVVLSIDRSISIGSNLGTMKTNIKGIFQRLGMDYGGKGIRLGFWTFSHDPNPNSTDYNKYAIGFTPVDGGTAAQLAAFNNKVDDIDLDGQTNYEQALSYNDGRANSDPVVTGLRTSADVVAIITDGIPNFPGDEDPDDSAPTPSPAESSARTALGKFMDDNTSPQDPAMLGFVLQNVSSFSMNYMLNGDKHVNTDSDGSQNVAPFIYASQGPSAPGAIEQLAKKIGDTCDARTPSGYSITPVANISGSSAIRSGEKVTVTHTATLTENLAPDPANPPKTDWSLVRVVLKPTDDPQKIKFGEPGSNCGTSANPYCDRMSCSKIQNSPYYSSDTKCDEIEHCSTVCPTPFPNVGDRDYGSKIDDTNDVLSDLKLGTKICYILKLNSPANGQSDRFSAAACVTVGKSPTVEVWGGDVRVGRVFGDNLSDISIARDAGVYTSSFTMPDDKLYGSWAEYGVFAPKAIKSIASMAGLAEGYDKNMLTTTGGSHDATCDTSALNRLTFANVPSSNQPSDPPTCGNLSDQIGTIPDVVTRFTAWQATPPLLTNTSPVAYSAWSTQVGRQLYRVGGTGDVHLGSTSGVVTVEPGKQIVLDLQGRNVFIDGDIQYADEKSPTDTYKSPGEVPQLVIIAKNITITKDVNRVDAWLIANGHSNAGDGTVMTCVPAVGSSGKKEVTASMCNAQLRVNGPIMARHLELWRTYGAEGDLDKSPGHTDTCNDATKNCPDANKSAEIINLPGTTLMWSVLPPTNPMALTTYSIELPPYF